MPEPLDFIGFSDTLQGGYRCDPEFVTVFYKEASTVTKGKSYFKISSVDDEREVEELAKEHISSTDKEGISKEYSELLLGDVWPECKDKELSSVQVYRLINRIEDNTYCSEVFYFGKDGKKYVVSVLYPDEDETARKDMMNQFLRVELITDAGH